MTLFFLRIARTMQINYFSPDDRLLPPSWISMSNSLWGCVGKIFFLLPSSFFCIFSLFKSYSRPASRSKLRISKSVACSFGSMLNLREPVNKVGSWGMMVTFSLSVFNAISEIFKPSIHIDPDSISTILLRLRLIVLFPAPVLPTIPIFFPPSISKVRPFSTKSVFGLYLSFTSLNVTFPFCGHDFSPWIIFTDDPSFSTGISNSLKHL